MKWFSGMILSLIVLIFSTSSLASLAQRGFLGIAPESAQGSEINVANVVANSTASALGVKVGDQLVALDSVKLTRFSHLLALLENKQVAKPISLTVKRDNKELVLKGLLKGRQQEKSDIADVIYDVVNVDNNQLRSIVYKPHGLTGKAPAIFFIQGYTCSSIDYGMIPNVSVKQMLDQYVASGYVVYRIEKFGVGDSQGELNCGEVDFTTEIAGFVAGLKALKQYDFVNENNITIFGHSLGVLAAPVVAQKESVAAIVGYGGVFKSWRDYMTDIYQVQSQQFGTSKKQAKENYSTMKPFLDDWLVSDKSWREISQSKAYKQVMQADLAPIQGQQVFHRDYLFFRDLNSYGFKSLWQQTKVPVLMIHGSLDIQAINKQWAYDIAATVNDAGGKAKAVELEGAEHIFMRYDNAEQYMSARQSGNYRITEPKKHFDDRIATTVTKWLKHL